MSPLFIGDHLGLGYLNYLLGLNTDEILPLFLYFVCSMVKSLPVRASEFQESREPSYPTIHYGMSADLPGHGSWTSVC